jgi:hypothetical protein
MSRSLRCVLSSIYYVPFDPDSFQHLSHCHRALLQGTPSNNVSHQSRDVIYPAYFTRDVNAEKQHAATIRTGMTSHSINSCSWVSDRLLDADVDVSTTALMIMMILIQDRDTRTYS